MTRAQLEFDKWFEGLIEGPGWAASILMDALYPKTWPEWWRRVYLLGLPIFGPLHLLAWIALLIVIAIGIVGFAAIYKAGMFWHGGRDD